MSHKDASTEVQPTPITGNDLRRAAACTEAHGGRYDLQHIELSPLGLMGTNGRILCLIHAAGWPYQCYLDANDAKKVPPTASLQVNGCLQFVEPSGNAISLAHKNPDELNFPQNWRKLLPDADALVPVATLNATYLKQALRGLQHDDTTFITFYGRADNAGAPLLLANNFGDLVIIMPVVDPNGETYHFPANTYQALGRHAETAQPLAIAQDPQAGNEPLLATPGEIGDEQ